MPPLTKIVCLANSRKHGARCIAGVNPDTGEWVRPVSGLDDGRLTRDLRLIDGREPELLEVLLAPLDGVGPDYGFESENRRLLNGQWRSGGRLAPEHVLRFCDAGPHILHNAERHVTVEYMQSLPPHERRTLQLIETTRFSTFHTGLSEHGGHKWHASLTTRYGARLTARVTDPCFVERLEDGHRPGDHCLVTVSLSMPYVPEDWTGEGAPCWKLIAAVIELQDSLGRAVRRTERPPTPAAAKAPPPTDGVSLARALRTVFGFDSFLRHQEGAVRAVLEGRDAFVVMPTGGGKSLCYQLPAHLLPGTCVVVSPLISLMKDQVDAAVANGLRAECYNSTLTREERLRVLGRLAQRDLDLLYVSPERLAMDAFLNHLKRTPVSLFAIDEAHCISEWGHDFRPDYLFLGELVERFPAVPVAAFTATATERVQTDIVARLGLRSPHVVRASFNRPNLFYKVVRKQKADQQILDFLRERPRQSGIVYRATREGVETTAAFLAAAGIAALPYHAGLDDHTRTRNQEAFDRDKIDVIVATIAFGMGIDKSNVRFVVHGDLPKNLESYYQETGRAGRDGEPAHCLLLFAYGDMRKARYWIDQMSDAEEREIALRKLRHMVNFASVCACRRRQLLEYFAETYEASSCGACDVCAGEVERVDGTQDARTVLSAIVQTRQRFGVGRVVDIVAGADTQEIRRWGLERLESYGSGGDKPKKHWRRIIDELIGQQHLVRTEGEYPVLNLTEKGCDVLHGEATVHVTKPVEKRASAPQPPPPPGECNPELFEALRALRRRIAAERQVPPYIVFSDRSLREMASRFPVTLEGMRAIHGVGNAKLEAFGEEFAATIREFAGSRPDAVAAAASCEARTPAPAPAPPPRRAGGSLLTTWELVQQGLDCAGIAARRGMAETTIMNHLQRLAAAGHAFDLDRYVPPGKRRRIEELLCSLAPDKLAPIVEASRNTVSYDEVRLVRAFVRRRARASLSATESRRQFSGG